MVTGEEHGRQALAAASMMAQARTLVIQADHEVTELKQLRDQVTAGSTNPHAESAMDAIWSAELSLGKSRDLLARSADDVDAYVDVVAPGLRQGRSVEPAPVPGDRLAEPPRRRGLRGADARITQPEGVRWRTRTSA